MIASS
jgi:hypothetical protein